MPERSQHELQKRIKSFQYAFEGLWHVLRTQKNSWIHTIATLVVIVVGVWLRLSRGDWAIIVLTIAMVWMTEFVNTAIEAVIDLSMPEKHPLAKVAKDVSAAAVLVGAVTAILVGILILGPRLLQRLTG